MTDEETDDWHDYDPYEPADECDHAEADIDLVTGQLSCHCGLWRAATTREVEAEARWQAEYARQEHEAEMEYEREQQSRVSDGMGGTCDA